MADQTFTLIGVIRDHLKRALPNTPVQIVPVPDVSTGDDGIYVQAITVTTDDQGRVTDGIDGYFGVKLVRFDGLQYMVAAPSVGLPPRSFTVPVADATIDLKAIPFGVPTLPPGADQVLADLLASAARLAGVQAVASANGALVPGKHNPVDATSGNRTMTVADATSAGQMVSVSKKDATANTVAVSVAHLRDGGAGSITLVGQHESLLLTSKADGSWWPVADHKTKAYLDSVYGPTAPGLTAAFAPVDGSGLVPAANMRAFVDRGTIAASTTYNRWDIATYRGRRILVVNSFTTSSGTAPFVSAANYVDLSGEARINAHLLGARGDGTTDSTTAIQTAIDLAAALGGGTVELPMGVILFSSTIVLKQNVWLAGQGIFGTYLKVANGANCGGIKTFVSTGPGVPNAAYCGIRNLTLDGNSSNATGGDGINFTTNPLTVNQSGTSLEQFDMHHVIENVRVRKFKGDGVHLAGRSAIQLKNVHCQYNDGYGFYSTFDTNYSHCEADQNGKSGFYINNGSIRLAACKSYLAGVDPATGSGTSPDATAAGFEFGSGANGAVLAAVEAQNCAGPGFRLNGCHGVNIQGVADSNNNNPTAAALQATRNANPAANATAVEFAAIELINVGSCILNVVCWQGVQASQVGSQYNALRVTTAAAGCDVQITHEGRLGVTVGPAVTSDSVALTGNAVSVNGTSLTRKLSTDVDVAIGSLADGQVLTYDAASGKWKNLTAGSTAFFAGAFGDGSDGALNFDGTATISGVTKSGSTYTLARDLMATSITIASGVTVVMAGYRLFCQGTLTNAGTISNAGNDASGFSGGAAGSTGALGSGQGGGAGGTTANGTAGPAGGVGMGNGGAGGASTPNTGGSGGASLSQQTSWVRQPQPGLTGVFNLFGAATALKGGGGGGGGASDGTNRGGGGGGGGAIVMIFARTVANSGVITAKGGNGAAGVAGNAGGGGGGAGGLILLYTQSAWTNTGTTNVAGGSAGAGTGTGSAGVAGGNGNVLNVVLQ